MVFSNLIFLYLFLPLCLAAYFLCRSVPAKNAVLIVFSLIFYAWGEPVYLFLMIAAAAVNWGFGLLIEKRHKRVFLVLALVLPLQEKYYKNFKHRELIIVIFLTYMALIVKTNIPVINSILIMLIALVSVTAGFVKKDKPVRIYGLVLSLCTCGKIALYDYWGAAILQKTILFFVVGVIALVIAGIYIILEKKCNE